MSLVTFEDGVYQWPRGVREKLSAYFWTSEFECHCGVCPTQIVAPELLNKLDSLRADLNQPLFINSGYRCHAYQSKLAAEGMQTANGISQHELGRAADISCRAYGGHVLGENFASKYFTSIGMAVGWCHVDLRPEKRRWVYVAG